MMMIEYETTMTVEECRQELERKYGSITRLRKRAARPEATFAEKVDIDEWDHLMRGGKDPNERIQVRQAAVFHDTRAFFRLITPERLRILDELRSGASYESIHELAKALRRDPKNVYQDVNALADKGLVKIHRRNKRRSVPRAAVDKIVITM